MSDPRKILGVAADAGEQEIRAAYLRKVKEHPPDHSPEEFEKIRDAYDTLRDPRKRAMQIFSEIDAGIPFASLLDGMPPVKRFAGPGPWLEVLKGK